MRFNMEHFACASPPFNSSGGILHQAASHGLVENAAMMAPFPRHKIKLKVKLKLQTFMQVAHARASCWCLRMTKPGMHGSPMHVQSIVTIRSSQTRSSKDGWRVEGFLFHLFVLFPKSYLHRPPPPISFPPRQN